MKIFSGIRPTGEFHLGHYLAVIKQWVELQQEHECIFSLANYHAITTPYLAKDMPKMIIEGTKDILACGVDPQKATIFLQSDRPEHTELAWLLNTISTMGELSRMTQYKEKSEKYEQLVGLFDYPILMAADILIYKAEGVPVGEDQTQHVELARDLARRLNSRYETDLPEPKVILREEKRVMSLSGQGKMSKSDAPNTYIALNDSPETIRQKISSATTDQGNETEISNATKNLIGLMESFGGKEEAEKWLSQRQSGTIKYAEFKPALAEAIVKELEPIQKKRAEISDEEVKNILRAGAEKLQPAALENIETIKTKMGLKI